MYFFNDPDEDALIPLVATQKVPLSNFGNSCYVNVIFQIFLHSYRLWSSLMRSYGSQHTIPSLAMQLRHDYCKAFNIRPTEQCDSVLFLSYLLDSKVQDIKAEWQQVWNTKLRCSVCKHTSFSSQTENFWVVYPNETDADYEIEDVVYDYDMTECIRVQQKQVVEKKCDKCNCSTNHLKVSSLGNHPQFLLFNLQLFTNKHVYICDGMELNINKHLQPTPLPDDEELQHDYNLVGVVRHVGSLHAGHYMGYFLDLDGWTCYNDSLVYSINDINSILTHRSPNQSFPLLIYAKSTTPQYSDEA